MSLSRNGSAYLFLTWTALAQPPAIFQGAVFNSASQMHPALPGGALARGGRFTVEGIRFSEPIEIRITSGQRTLPARLLSDSADRLEALVPDEAPLGEATLVVTAAGESSLPFKTRIVESSPGLYRPAQSSERSNAPGSSFLLRATGIGPARGMEIFVAGKRAVWALAAPRKDGIDTVRVTIPRDTPEGCQVPVLARIAGRVSNAVAIPIRIGAGTCVPPPAWPLDNLAPGARAGLMVVTRSAVESDSSVGPISFVNDGAAAAFLDVAPGAAAFSPLRGIPPQGVCTTFQGTLHSSALLGESLPEFILNGVQGSGLDAGEIVLESSAGKQRLYSGRKGFYGARVGGDLPNQPMPLFLEPGKLHITGMGGKDVGAFQTILDSPHPFVWRNAESLKSIDRAKGFTVEWSGTPPGQRIGILILNVDQMTSAMGLCFCLAKLGQSSFTVPPLVLANLPASTARSGIPMDVLIVMTHPTGDTKVQGVQGLERMVSVSSYAHVHNVTIR